MGCGANSKLYQDKDEGPHVEPYYEKPRAPENPPPAHTEAGTGGEGGEGEGGEKKEEERGKVGEGSGAERGGGEGEGEGGKKGEELKKDQSFFTREAATRGAMMD
mmetsp:Transcript_32871/g.84892  ORF Transcript_32871/g.84892 Transcript_32871/m.84892 type:complete len:105 (-) Transcript_32871:552-866(-)